MFFSSLTSTQLHLLLARVLFGGTGQMGTSSQRRWREAELAFLPHSPTPSFQPPGTAANRPCPEPGRQALSTGGPRASSLSPRPQLPLLAPKDTDGKGFPGTQPNCLCRFARKEIQTPQHKKKSSKWIQAFSALLTFSLLLGLLHGSYSSMLDRETLAYTSSLLSLL